MRGIPPFGENKKAPGGWKKSSVWGGWTSLCGCIARNGPHWANRGGVSHWGENGAYWGGQAAYSLFTIWERMGRQTHQSYQCETYAFFFLLGSEFLGRTERSELSSSQLVKKQGGEVRRGGEAAHRCLPFRSRFCSTKPAPQKGALPPWKGSLWDLPRLLGNLSKNPPETFTQPPAEKTGEKKKAGSLTWDEPGKRPRQMGKSDQKCSGIPHPIYGKQVCEPSGKKPANPHKT